MMKIMSLSMLPRPAPIKYKRLLMCTIGTTKRISSRLQKVTSLIASKAQRTLSARLATLKGQAR